MNEIILTSSVLILILAALRYILRGKISPSLQYALWLLVAVRLLIPGTLFVTPVSLVGLFEEVQTAAEQPVIEDEHDPLQPSPPIYIPGEVITITPSPEPQPGVSSPNIPPAAAVPVEPSSPAISIDWQDLIWKAGILTVSTAFVISNLVFYRRLRRTRHRIPAGELPITCHVPVYYADRLHSPCLFGRSIYINHAAMHPSRLRHVLLHEMTHRRHGDQLWAVLRCVCLAVHWYNPLVWWAAILSRRDCELSCDSDVMRRLDDPSCISYGETLMAMLTTSPAGLLHTATTMSAGKRTMAERLKLIVHRPRMMKLTLIAVALITTGAVILTFGGCAEKSDEPEPDTTINTPDDTDLHEDVTLPEDDSGKLTPPEGGFGYIPSPTYIHPSGLFTMKLPADCPVITVESEDGVSFYDAEIYQSGSEDGWILSVYPQPASWVTDQTVLASFDPNGTAQNYLLEYNGAYADQYAELFELIAESFALNAASGQFSRLVHDNFEENIALAVSYLPYLSWRNYREVYGEDAMMQLLDALWQFANSGSASWDQYHDLLSTTNDGLDGAYSEGLSAIFAALYLKNSEQFLSVINSEFITDTERERVAKYVKYELDSEPNEGDSEEVTFDDGEVMMGLSRSYGPTAWSVGSPAELTLTLTGDWTLDGIRAALFAALSEHVSGTLLEGDLTEIEIGYSFRFPEEMHDGVILTVPYHATYVDQNVHTLPSGATFSPASRTGELIATIRLVGEGITAPVDEAFARGQALYDLLAQIIVLEDLTVSRTEEQFQPLEIVRVTMEQRLQDMGLSESCTLTSLSAGGYYNPCWCDVGYEQSIEYSVSILYTESGKTYQYTFRNSVKVTTTE